MRHIKNEENITGETSESHPDNVACKCASHEKKKTKSPNNFPPPTPTKREDSRSPNETLYQTEQKFYSRKILYLFQQEKSILKQISITSNNYATPNNKPFLLFSMKNILYSNIFAGKQNENRTISNRGKCYPAKLYRYSTCNQESWFPWFLYRHLRSKVCSRSTSN